MNATAINPAQLTYEAKKAQALSRLEFIGSHENTIRQVEENGILTRYESPSGTPNPLATPEHFPVSEISRTVSTPWST